MKDQKRLFDDETLFSDFGGEEDFFETPPHAVELLVPLLPKAERWALLEPSAGRGAIIDVAIRQLPISSVRAVEINPTRFKELVEKHPAIDAEHGDFFHAERLVRSWQEEPERKLLISNPPYSKPSKNIGVDFVERCLEITTAVKGVAAFLVPLDFACGADRSERIHNKYTASLFPFRVRPGFTGNGSESGQRPYAWFLYDTLEPDMIWRVIG